ncbi:MAG: hypothetical protein H7839_03790 [Magnetococcus sp. YQC-5]
MNIEWKLLTGSVLLLLFSLVVDAAMIMGGIYYQDEADDNLAKLKKSIAVLRSQKQQQEDQGHILATIQPQYERLRQQGLVGPEPRMSWVEALKDAEKVLQLPGPIHFKLEPSRPYVPPFPLPTNKDFQLFASRMEVTVGLLHEGDLLEWIEFMEQKQVGLFHFKQCKLQGVGKELQEEQKLKVGINLQGFCVMDWFNLREMEQKIKVK